MKNRDESIYKDPRWQKKRLEVMNNQGFKCKWCSSGTKELQVHHLEYKKGYEIWDYEDSSFIVLCKRDHERFHNALNFFSNLLAFLNDGEKKKLVNFAIELIDKHEE